MATVLASATHVQATMCAYILAVTQRQIKLAACAGATPTVRAATTSEYGRSSHTGIPKMYVYIT